MRIPDVALHQHVNVKEQRPRQNRPSGQILSMLALCSLMGSPSHFLHTMLQIDWATPCNICLLFVRRDQIVQALAIFPLKSLQCAGVPGVFWQKARSASQSGFSYIISQSVHVKDQPRPQPQPQPRMQAVLLKVPDHHNLCLRQLHASMMSEMMLGARQPSPVVPMLPNQPARMCWVVK